MKLIEVLKGKGYNPYRGKGGRFASGNGGGKSKSASPKVMDEHDYQGYWGAERFASGELPLISRGRARGFGAKTDEVYADTVADPNGVEVNVFNVTRNEQHSFHYAGTQGVTGMSKEDVEGIVRTFPKNWTPKLLRKHNFHRIN